MCFRHSPEQEYSKHVGCLYFDIQVYGLLFKNYSLMKASVIRTLIALLAFGAFVLPLSSQPQNNIRVLSYYSGPPEALDNYDANKMTHIIFCFGRLTVTYSV